MANAQEDLAGNVGGRFSPDDWDKILSRAAEQLRASAKPEGEAWVDVIRDFHRERYWGFTPDYVAPKKPPEKGNFGKRFIWYICRSFLITKVLVLWFGARYSADQDPIYAYLFFAALAFAPISYGIFVWRYGRGWQEERLEDSQK